MNLTQLKQMMMGAGCIKLYAKSLAENDNSKNQVYFGPGFEALNLFPNTGIEADTDAKNHTFKAKINFGWLLPTGQVTNAPRAQLILYPQYPEVRFSGFLSGSKGAPSSLMAGRILGRVLFIGVTPGERTVGFVVGHDSPIAAEFRAGGIQPDKGVFVELTLPTIPTPDVARTRLLEELGRIHRLGWIVSKQLRANGEFTSCEAPQCGGFTLEAELGIPKNSSAAPDFMGWEIKQYAVANFDRPESAKAITLMTPEPNGGFYRENGVAAFVRKFGYADRSGRADRMNFGGKHSVNIKCQLTNLTMALTGFDSTAGRIRDAGGAVELRNDGGEIAASWSFSKILEHWLHKHKKVVYVPSQRRVEQGWEYRYGKRVRLAEQTDPLRLLASLADGKVYYDPGIKLENASTTAVTKSRSQFRIGSRDIAALYQDVNVVDVL
jgi:hypothetical protein